MSAISRNVSNQQDHPNQSDPRDIWTATVQQCQYHYQCKCHSTLQYSTILSPVPVLCCTSSITSPTKIAQYQCLVDLLTNASTFIIARSTQTTTCYYRCQSTPPPLTTTQFDDEHQNVKIYHMFELYMYVGYCWSRDPVTFQNM